MPRSLSAAHSAAECASDRLPEALELKVELVSPAALLPYAGNARTHSPKQISQIAASIRRHGFISPALIADDSTIVAGHGRVAAAQKLGLQQIPVIRLSHLSAAELQLYRIADNQIALNAGWDRDVLAIELQQLDALELDLPLELTGFEGAELDQLLELKPQPKADKADRIPEPIGPAVTRRGDLWRLGKHLLYCGDACDPESYAQLLGSERARMVFADPPYNCPIDGYVGGLGKVQHRDFVMGSGEMTGAEFRDFLGRYMRACAGASVDGAIHYHCMDWKGLGTLLAAGTEVYPEQKNLIVWAKTNGGMGSFYRSRHELIAVFKVGSSPHVNNFGLGETGRYRTNVWDYPGVNAFGRDRDEALGMHPTVKPVAMVADAIKDVSKPDEIVLDPFGGSGTTLIAAQKTRRRARLLELDELYCDVICRRWRAFAGEPAMLEASGETFDQLSANRTGGSSNDEEADAEA